MKPEHAQEIYDIISNLDDLANSHCIGDRDKIDEAVERAFVLLGLERPDVPEPGTVVEAKFFKSEIYQLCYVWDFRDGKKEVESIMSPQTTRIEKCNNWRYPGEKEWRE